MGTPEKKNCRKRHLGEATQYLPSLQDASLLVWQSGKTRIEKKEPADRRVL